MIQATNNKSVGSCKRGPTETEIGRDLGVKLVESINQDVQGLVNKYFRRIVNSKGKEKARWIKEVTPKLIQLGLSQANVARIFQFSPQYLSQLKLADEQFEAQIEDGRTLPIEIIENVCFINALKSAVDPRYQTSMMTLKATTLVRWTLRGWLSMVPRCWRCFRSSTR